MGKFLHTSYTDFLNLPTYSRKYLINKIMEYHTSDK